MKKLMLMLSVATFAVFGLTACCSKPCDSCTCTKEKSCQMANCPKCAKSKDCSKAKECCAKAKECPKPAAAEQK